MKKASAGGGSDYVSSQCIKRFQTASKTAAGGGASYIENEKTVRVLFYAYWIFRVFQIGRAHV